MNNLTSNLPEKFLQRLQRLYSEKELEKILQAIQTKPLPSFRTNTLKTNTPELEKKLKNQDFIIEHIPWYPDAFILKNKSIRELTETEEYKRGEIYIQNLSSMIPAIVLDPKPNEKVLDLCAAPGSKTTQIAALMENQGLIVANDVSRQRLYKMETILNLYGIPFQKTHFNVIARGNDEAIRSEIAALPVYPEQGRRARNDDQKTLPSLLITNIPGERLWQRYPEYFDKTLVDVPCSMEGRVRLDDPDSYQDWKLGKIRELEVKQKYLLRSAISATKVGGIIVYSTCTLAPEENEGVIDWILKKEGNAVAIEKIELPNLKLKPMLTKWGNKKYSSLVHVLRSLGEVGSLTSRVDPTALMEGFFIVKLRKTASTIQL